MYLSEPMLARGRIHSQARDGLKKKHLIFMQLIFLSMLSFASVSWDL